MLRFDAIELQGLQSAFRSTTRPPLPLYVEPGRGEALLSWLSRLATRLGISLHTLARESFGVDDRFGHTRWWCRPHPGVLTRISEQTGLGIERLRHMTFQRLQPVYRDDEAGERFAGRRYDAPASKRRTHRFAICGACVEGDTNPYLRSSWLIGWMAACPQHATILIERCRACSAKLRVARLQSVAEFSPTTCVRCSKNVSAGVHPSAHPSVMRIQAALLHGKCEGAAELPGLGRLTWKEMVALADVLIGMMQTHLILAEQQQIIRLYVSEMLGSPVDGGFYIYGDRYGSLRLLAWLIEGWPDSPGAKVGRELLIRWLAADRNRLCRHLRPFGADPWTIGPTNFEPPIRERLEALAGAGRP